MLVEFEPCLKDTSVPHKLSTRVSLVYPSETSCMHGHGQVRTPFTAKINSMGRVSGETFVYLPSIRRERIIGEADRTVGRGASP